MKLRNLFRTKANKVLGLTAVILVGAAIGIGLTHNGQARASDCDNNAIVWCGYSTPQDLINKVSANNDGHGHGDLQAIYSNYGMVPAEYGKFVASARPGVAYKDGRIVVDGQVVATGGRSIGRIAANQGPGYFTTAQINGVSYYGNTNDKAFASDALPLMAMFDANGTLQFAVLNACGNPEWGTPVQPSYACNMLHSTKVAGTDATYSFTTDAAAANNASVAKVTYDFGDGTTQDVANPATPVQHKYIKAGNYKVTVTVTVNLPGNQTKTVTSTNCATMIEVKLPIYSCVQLLGSVVDASKFQYRFTATYKALNGATIKDVNIDFGDGNSAKATINGQNATAVADHQYGSAGNYNIVATLRFNAGEKGVQSVKCETSVSPKVNECKPGIPVGDDRCSPCPEHPEYPSNSPQCQPDTTTPPPTTLVNTGPGEVAGLFAGISGLGTAGHMALNRFRRRK